MWKVHGKSYNNNSVAIQTTVGKLRLSNLKAKGLEFYLKNVQYAKTEDIKGKLSYITPFFIKLPCFKFENEDRIVLSTYSPYRPNKDTPDGILVKTKKMTEVIEKVLVHPDSDNYFFDKVDYFSRQYGLKKNIVEKGVYGNKA